VLGSVLCLGKAVVVFMHVTLWRKRAERMKKIVGAKAERTQIPFVPILGVFSFIIYCIILLMTSLDIANARNGWAGALYSIGWLIFATISTLYFLKMLRLGKRLIPLSKKIVNSAGAAVEIQGDNLGKSNAVGTALFLGQSFTAIGQFVLFVIVGLSRPLDVGIVMAALGVMALFLCIHGGALVWLVERAINAIKRSHYKTSSSDGNNNGTSRMRSDLQTIVNKMRLQQLVSLVLTSSGAVVYALAIARVIPLAWYVMLIHMYYDTIANLVVAFSMARRARNHNQQQGPRGARSPMKSPTADGDANKTGLGEAGLTARVESLDSGSTLGLRNIPPSTDISANQGGPQNQPQSSDAGMVMIYESKIDDDDEK
jgi:hypothetical protein